MSFLPNVNLAVDPAIRRGSAAPRRAPTFKKILFDDNTYVNKYFKYPNLREFKKANFLQEKTFLLQEKIGQKIDNQILW